jgi:AraC-like DNA-binding protein
MTRRKQWTEEVMAMTLRRAAEYIDQNSCNYFTVSQLALHCGCKISFLNAAFVNACGFTTQVFLRRYRLRKLRGAIKSNPDNQIDDLAATCGTKITPTIKREFAALYSVNIFKFKEQCEKEKIDGSLQITQEDCANATDMIKGGASAKRSTQSKWRSWD